MAYMDLIKHYENCFDMYGDNNKGVDWPNREDVLTRYRVMLEVMDFDTDKTSKDGVSVLDFGCGLGHMYDYIKENNYTCKYEGLDVSEKFINKCREKYPEADFILRDILKEKEVPSQTWDYIVMNGVFTEKREMSFDEMLSYFKEMIKKVYSMCNKGIAFNVMSKDVDWERDDLFHLPLNVLSGFLTKEITRNFIIRYDYGLYEYTVYVYKKNQDRPIDDMEKIKK